LATAWHLRQSGGDRCRVVVLEESGRPGGTAWTERIDGYLLETGPNGFLDNKPSTLDLCRSLGVRLVRANESARDRFVYLGDKLRRLPTSPGEFLRSDLLSWRGKLRVLCERLLRGPIPTDESIYEFGVRRLGREATEVLLDTVVTGILAGDSRLLSLPACFPRIAELERRYGSLIRAQAHLAKARRRGMREKHASTGQAPVGSPGGTLTVPEGGTRVLIERLVEQLGSAVRLCCGARRIERNPAGGWVVVGESQTFATDAVVLACPAYKQAEILDPLDAELAGEIGAIPYVGVVVVVVGFRRVEMPSERTGFGYLAPQRLGRPVLGVVWSSSILPDQAPSDCLQFRAILGGWRRRDVLAWDDTTLVRQVREDLQATMRISAAPCFTWTCRWERAIPQYHVGHLDRLAKIDERRRVHFGLFLTGNCYRGVSLNDCTLDAEQTSRHVLRYLAGASAGKPDRC
jgi:oxygen-dependent protoporphyrinogen oxidase